ncbi:MAG: hypothetical protein H0U71_00555 [Gammaproteobacteria bacterium]|nr:hypothetical protein [Gammaproteobacteria bacterium]
MKIKTEKASTKARHKANPYLKMRVRKDEDNFKTAALLDKNIVPSGVDQGEFEQQILNKFNEIPGNRPVAEVGSPSNTPQKRPKYVISPDGHKYLLDKSVGFLLIYSNATVTEISRNTVPLIPENVRNNLENTTALKFEAITITNELIEEMLEQRRKGLKRGTNGIPDQNSTMVKKGITPQEGSATKNAQQLGLAAPGEIWEWLHLILFFLKGRAAQKVQNLTGGTKHANTDMIFAEDELLYLGQHLDEEIYLVVTPTEIDQTHFADEINFTIITPKFIIPYSKGDYETAAALGSFTASDALINREIAAKEFRKAIVYGEQLKQHYPILGDILCMNICFTVIRETRNLEEASDYGELGLDYISSLEALKNESSSLQYLEISGWGETLIQNYQGIDGLIEMGQEYFEGHVMQNSSSYKM